MRVAVTGASGHLGAALTRRLLQEGFRTRALVRTDARALEGLEVERVAGDLFDEPSLARTFDAVEIVFHLAGKISIHGDPDGGVRRTNVLGTRNVVRASLAAGVRRIVHFSSIHAFADPGAGKTLDEGARDADGSDFPAYDRSKVDGQKEVLAASDQGLEPVVLHPAASIGPWDFKPSRMGRVLLDMAAGRVPVLVAGGFAWVDTRDVAAAAVAAARSAPPGARYLLAGTWRPVSDVAAIVAAHVRTRPARLVCPLALARAGAPVAEWLARIRGSEPMFTRESLRALSEHRKVSCARAVADLGFSPRPLEATVADTLDWFRSEAEG